MSRCRAVLLALCLTGCASSDPALYTLVMKPGAAVPGPARTITVRTPVLPRYVERREIVRRDRGERMQASDDDWWSEPLADMIRRVLVADLAQRLPGAQLLSSDGIAGELATVEIEVEVQRFDLDPGRRAVISGFAAIEEKGRPRQLIRVQTTGDVERGELSAQVDAMSLALARVADTIAASLRL